MNNSDFYCNNRSWRSYVSCFTTRYSFFLLMLLSVFCTQSNAQNSWNIQLNQSSLDCSASEVCYQVELQNVGGGSWALGDQNYRFFFDGDLMTVTSVTSLLPNTFYGVANIDQNIKISGQGQDAASPLDDIDDNLGFLDFSIVQTDKSNPPAATQINNTFTPTAEICIAVDASVINDPTGAACLSIYHSRPSTAGSITNQYTVFSENDNPGSTIATTGVGYDDLTPADGSDACLSLICSPCASQGGDTDNDGVCDDSDCAPNDPSLPTTPGTACDDNDANTVMDVILADGCTCEGTPMANLNNWDIQLTLDNVDCANNEACYLVQVQNTSGASWALGDQNYRLFFDGDLMTVTSVTSLLPNTFYSGATIDQNTKVSGQGQDAASPLDDIDDNLGFLDFNMVQIDKSNPPNATQAVQGTWTSTAEICVAVDPSVINDFAGGTCLAFYHSRPATAGTFTNQYTTITENDAPNSTIMTMGATYNDLTSADGTDACVGPLCAPCANAGGDSDNDGVCDDDDCAPQDSNLPATPGTTCDDNDPTTVNDVYLADGCTCEGTFDPCATAGGDSDNDGVCDDDDCAPQDPNLPTTPGTTCDDNDPTTVNDVYLADGCTCEGTFDPCATAGGDSDNDGVCDDDDCAPLNPNLPAPVGSTCDDNNPNTVNDVYLADGCTCEGTFDSCATQGGDSDNDGVCDNNDCAPLNPNLPAPAGSACNDNNSNTVNDVYLADGCTCQGTLDPCAIAGGDSDNDGVCDDADCAPLNPNLPATPGTTCDDGNPNTVNDVIQADGCTCNGVVDPCVANGGDSDNDGVCDNDDCAPLNPNLPTTPGTVCNDNNPNTINDVYLADGCTCEGTFDSCATQGGDSDNDGVCDDVDCAPLNPNLPTTPGTACGDGDPNTINDVIQADGCTCQGTFDPCATAGGDSDNDGVCDDDDCAPNNPNLPTTPGTACDDGNPNTVNDIIKADGCTCQGTPQTIDCSNISIAAGTNSIIVSGLDGAPISSLQIFNTQWQQEFSCFADCDATETVAVIPGTYYVYAKYYDGSYTLICQENVTITVTDGGGNCDNVTNGGKIGFGNSCENSTEICGASGTAPIIGNCISATGGSGSLQYIWIKNEVNCIPPTVTIDEILANPAISNWQIITGATGASYNPGVVSVNTCYTRCARRANCDDYEGEANIVSITVDPNCGGGEPDCDDITITAGNGTITVNGLDGAPISSLQIFNAQYQTEFNCFANCNATETVTLAAGTYYVYAKYYTATYQLICQEIQTIVVTGGGCTDNDNDGVCVDDDCDDSNPNVPAAVGSACDDGNNNTTDDVIQADGCTCQGIPVTTCDNVNFGGQIGFGAICSGSYDVCNGDDAPIISSCTSPSGGSGDLEIVWLRNEVNCSPPNVTLAQIIANPNVSNWEIIAGATDLSFDPGALNTSTCYLRCARRTGCDAYLGESNIIQITVDDNCGGGGDPDCNDISITTGNGTIIVSGLDGAPISSLQIFNSQWQQEFSCFADCGATETVPVSPGDYYVYAKYYTTGYTLICQNYQVVTTSSSGCTDADNDGVCVDDDCDDSNPNVPATIGSSCDDGNTNTNNDVIQADGCTCAGMPITDPCNNAGGDADNDGVCADDDCDDNNPNVPAAVGSPCNDGNANTTNDVIQADGCTCEGIPDNGNPDCNDISITTGNGTIIVSGLDGAPISSLQIFNSQWQQEFSCFADCGATETIPVNSGTYYVYAKYYTANYALICQENQTIAVTNGGNGCSNLTDGGEIGFSVHCDPLADYCPGNGAVSAIESCIYPSGGNGTIEYIWLKSTTTSTPPTGAVINDPDWDVVTGATQAEYLPTNVSETTYFIRCARRASCVNYTGESNVVTVLVDPNCGGGGGTTDPNCNDVTITASGGNIITTGLDGAPITSVQVFNASWQTEFACFADCDSPIQSIPVSDGTYYIYVKYYSANYSLICTVEETLNVVNGMALISNDSNVTTGFNFQVNKWTEHSEAMWAHNEGHLVSTYTLERSVDGQDFEAISETVSKGTALTSTYQSYDIEPIIGDNFYRIRMNYIDGIVIYSAIQKVHFTDIIDFNLFPNPANRFVKVNLEEVLGEKVTIKIYNNLGQELKAIHLNEVFNKYYQMDLQELKEGHYTVWLSVPGRRAIAKKLVIGRI